MKSVGLPAALALVAALGAAVGCAPNVDPGCGACDGRGQVCDELHGECVVEEVALDSSEPDPGAVMPDFTGKIVPFFRGTACTVHSVQSGSAIPVQVTPCLHPCLTISEFNYHHMYECFGSNCEAYVLAYYTVDGAACPADVFGRFPAGANLENCNTDPAATVNVAMNISIDEMPFSGQIQLEIPYLSNADIAEIDQVSGSAKSDVAHEKIYQYPPQPSRVVGGMKISMTANDTPPPADCTTGACQCFRIEI